VAAVLQKELALSVDLEVGAPGSFIVLIDGHAVVEKEGLRFPTEEEILAAVRKELGK
jgi:hypothetical protein